MFPSLETFHVLETVLLVERERHILRNPEKETFPLRFHNITHKNKISFGFKLKGLFIWKTQSFHFKKNALAISKPLPEPLPHWRRPLFFPRKLSFPSITVFCLTNDGSLESSHATPAAKPTIPGTPRAAVLPTLMASTPHMFSSNTQARPGEQTPQQTARWHQDGSGTAELTQSLPLMWSPCKLS